MPGRVPPSRGHGDCCAGFHPSRPGAPAMWPLVERADVKSREDLVSTLAARPSYNCLAMHGHFSISRLVMAAGLMSALAANTVLPRWTACGMTELAARRRQPCCCGTQSGTCCGSICCRLPATPPKDQGQTPPSGEERGLAVLDTLAAVAGHEGAEGPWPRVEQHTLCTDASGTTLVGLSIRLNI
jgi:hypothetical protein